MAQQFGALVAFAKDQGSIPSIHIMAYNHPNSSSRGSIAPFRYTESAYTHTHIHAHKPFIYMIYIRLKI